VAIVQRINGALAKILTEQDVVKRFDEQGVTAGRMTPVELAAFIRSETAKWTRTAKDAGIATE